MFFKISIESFDKFNFGDSQWPVIIAQRESSPSNATQQAPDVCNVFQNDFFEGTSFGLCSALNNATLTFPFDDRLSLNETSPLTPPIVSFPIFPRNQPNSVRPNRDLCCNERNSILASESSIHVGKQSSISCPTPENFFYEDCQTTTMSHISPPDGHSVDRQPNSNAIKKQENFESQANSDLFSSNFDLNDLCDFVTSDELFSDLNLNDLPEDISDCFDDIYRTLNFEPVHRTTSSILNDNKRSAFVPIDHEYCKLNIDDHIDYRIAQAQFDNLVAAEPNFGVQSPFTSSQVDVSTVEERHEDNMSRRLKSNEASRISRFVKKCKLEARRAEIIALEDRNARLRAEIASMETLRGELKRQFSILMSGRF